MTIVHRPGKLHQDADGMSRIPDSLECCSCYEAGKELDQLPCGGCKSCSRAHNQWSRFYEDVDDVPLAVRAVSLVGGSISDTDEDNYWFQSLSKERLREHQLEDPDLNPIISWLEGNQNPSSQKLFLTSRNTKHLWLCKPHLQMHNGTLYYQWAVGQLVLSW